MSTASERLPILVTKEQKARIAKKAKAAKLTMGEFVRRAADAYQPDEDEKLLEGLLDQVMKTTSQASRAIDDTLAFIAISQDRIKTMEADHAARKVI